jgi:hypothetical protein
MRRGRSSRGRGSRRSFWLVVLSFGEKKRREEKRREDPSPTRNFGAWGTDGKDNSRTHPVLGDAKGRPPTEGIPNKQRWLAHTSRETGVVNSCAWEALAYILRHNLEVKAG